MERKHQKRDQAYLEIQDQLIERLRRFVPVHLQDRFVGWWITNQAEHFRKTCDWIEQHQGIND